MAHLAEHPAERVVDELLQVVPVVGRHDPVGRAGRAGRATLPRRGSLTGPGPGPRRRGVVLEALGAEHAGVQDDQLVAQHLHHPRRSPVDLVAGVLLVPVALVDVDGQGQHVVDGDEDAQAGAPARPLRQLGGEDGHRAAGRGRVDPVGQTDPEP